ncbi:MAG: FprA family A-type flavoprotein, partial [Ruminococcus sp.]|nr:FprA family A-type flavoprotein [Ruminococcus sp.]
MADVTISKDIIYIGASTRELDLFESQYIVPEGMAYNSYLILDDKVCVMDTCDPIVEEQWLENLKNALNGRSVDYL